MTLGERAYKLRAAGHSWRVVAAMIYGAPDRSHHALMTARHYARKQGKPWPVGRAPLKP